MKMMAKAAARPVSTRAVIAGLAALSLCGLWVNSAGAQDEKQSPADVLHMLKGLRHGALAAAPKSGCGVAELEFEMKVPERMPKPATKHIPGGESRSVAKHAVEFAFIGRDGLRREFHPEKRELVVESYLEQGGTQTHYWSGDMSPAPRDVTIRPYETPVSDLHGRMEWTYSELTSEPVIDDTDPTVLLSRGARVVTNGDMVIVTLNSSAPQGTIISWSRRWEFSKAHSGMLTRYTRHQLNRPKGEPEWELSEDYSTRWTEQNGFPVPVERNKEVKEVSEGHATGEIRCHAEFKRFVLEAVDRSELSIGKMGIPNGTLVEDSVLKRDWTYGQEAGTVGTEVSPTPVPAKLDAD